MPAGLGSVNGTPDLFRLQRRAVAVEPDATAALAAATVVPGRIRRALRQHGVAGAGETITDVVRVGGTSLRFDGVYFLISDD